MKKTLYFALLFALILPHLIYGQVHYDYPKCSSQTDYDIKIVKVTCEVTGTIIDFEYNRTESYGINIYLDPPGSYKALFIKVDDKMYKLISTSGIGDKDGITKAYPNKPVYFSATFEPIPLSAKYFNLKEGTTGYWNFYGVKLNNPINNDNKTSKPSNSTTTINPNNYSTLDEAKAYFIKNINNLATIEGIWSYSVTVPKEILGQLFNGQDLVRTDIEQRVLIKEGDVYVIYTIVGKYLEKINNESFSKTATNGLYIHEFIPTSEPYESWKDFTSFTNANIFKLNLTNSGGKYNGTIARRDTYVRIFPDDKTIQDAMTKSQKSTGTGFAVASNGYIITCNHVIDGAGSIKVKGINGNFNKAYTAMVSASDKNNDLAILKINDASFTSLGTIPYTIKSPTSDVGTSIFIMGYPLTATMGDEVKLTDGIISAKSGFTGDITSYQISAAAQPGNSGGPLFDKNGNIIGIVNAKHVQAENATYAVKSSYLQNLIESLPTTPVLQKVNILTGKSLPEQVKLIKNFVYIIEVN